jgi:predicted metal-dependent hydrolase
MDIEYNVIFSDRKTLGLTVERDASVVVRAPEGTDWKRIEEFVQKRKFWIREKQSHPQKYRPPKPIKEFVSGESVLYLGRNYRLEIRESESEFIKLAGKFFVCGPRGANLKDAFRQWFVDSAKTRIPLRVRHYAEKIGVSYNSVVISDMKYRWGACTPNENLSFNWRLIKAPMHVIDYVVVHELAHLLEHNHSPRFWQHVKTQIPNFEASKNWLKAQGQCLEDDF